MAYTYKVWIVDGKEHFEYGNGQTRKKDFPFAESLMKLLYLDIWSFADLFEGMGKSIVKLYETKEQQYSDNVLSALNTVAKKHIYFELLRLDWWERLEKAKAQGYKDIVVLLPRKKLPHTSHHAEADEGALCAGVGSGFKSKGVGAAKDGAVL